MIEVVKHPSQATETQENERFVKMIPLIRQQARRAFRRMRSEIKDELVEEVIANAFYRFSRLVRTSRAELGYATPLADYGIRQVIAGRRVGSKFNKRDIASPAAKALGIVIRRLDVPGPEQGDWREVLVEDRRATPADTAAARIDLAAWFRSLSPRNRQLAETLARGESATEAAHRFNLSQARISQLRDLLEASWEQFHKGPNSAECHASPFCVNSSVQHHHQMLAGEQA
jgi:hypothetical protein